MKRALLHILSASLLCSTVVACDDGSDSSEPAAAADSGAGKADDAEGSVAVSNIGCSGFENCYDVDEWDCLASVSEGELDPVDFAGLCCDLTNYDFCYEYGEFNCEIEDGEFSECLNSATSSEEEAYCIERTEDPSALEGMLECCASGDHAFCEYVTDPEDGDLCRAAEEQYTQCEPVAGHEMCAVIVHDDFPQYGFDCCGGTVTGAAAALCAG